MKLQNHIHARVFQHRQHHKAVQGYLEPNRVRISPQFSADEFVNLIQPRRGD